MTNQRISQAQLIRRMFWGGLFLAILAIFCLILIPKFSIILYNNVQKKALETMSENPAANARIGNIRYVKTEYHYIDPRRYSGDARGTVHVAGSLGKGTLIFSARRDFNSDGSWHITHLELVNIDDTNDKIEIIHKN
jgi:hypothetical protein